MNDVTSKIFSEFRVIRVVQRWVVVYRTDIWAFMTNGREAKALKVG